MNNEMNDNPFNDNIRIMVATADHVSYVSEILHTIEESSKVRGTGIAKRSEDYVKQKMLEGKAIIALADGRFAGFCYIETWSNKSYICNSGLIVHPDFRGFHLATRIKHRSFRLSREKFPEAKCFSLTSGAAMLKINSDLGYRPVTFPELTLDDSFWNGCKGCVNHDILDRTDRRYCICTAMLFDPNDPHCHPHLKVIEE